MASKVYAIKEGFDKSLNQKIENKIVYSWNECLKYVKGVKGAKYKSFESMELAKEYLSKESLMLKKGVDQYPSDWHHAYVDGSYNDATGKYGYGVVIVKDNKVVYLENGEANDNSKKDIRQIAGELDGSISSLKFAVHQNIKELLIFHDYEGVSHHATGFWERREKSSVDYYNEFNKIVGENNLKVLFVKVDSHTGDLFNEMADELAKAACGVAVNGEVEKYLSSNKILVKDYIVRQKLCEIVSEKAAQNIEVINEEDSGYESSRECRHLDYEEKTIDTLDIFNGNVINVKLHKVRLPNGKIAQREIVLHNGGAFVIPMNQDGEIYMVRQFRKPLEGLSLELPAGKLEPGENPAECASRELREETGLEAKSIKFVMCINSTPGFCSEKLHMYIATDIKEGKPCTDEDEFLHTEKIHISKLVEMVLCGEITDSKTIIGILYAEKVYKGEL